MKLGSIKTGKTASSYFPDERELKNYTVSEALALEAEEYKNGVYNNAKDATNDQYYVQPNVGGAFCRQIIASCLELMTR